MTSDIKFTSFEKQVVAALEAAADDTIYDFAEEVKTKAERRTPVDTGELKRSWDVIEGKNEARIVNDAEHALMIEKGTRYQRAQPMLRPALDETKSKAQAIAKEHFDQHLK